MKNQQHLWLVHMQSILENLGACVATSGPGAIHLLNGLYDAKADNTPVIAITGTTYSDLMNSSYQQDVNLLQLFSDVTVYNSMITVPEQAEMAVDIACRTALAQRGVSHLTIPIDVQEKKLNGKYSRHNVAYHTSDVYITETSPSHSLIEKAAKILNSGNKSCYIGRTRSTWIRRRSYCSCRKIRCSSC